MTLTCSGLKFCSPDDAKLVIHAARKGYLPYTTQRLSQAERSEIRPGDVYVWFGRGADALTGTPALERWTDGHSWGPSRMKDEYLYYHEKRAGEVTPVSAGHSARFVSSDPTHFESPSPSRSGAVSDPRPPPHPDNGPADPNQLIKQTYSVICDPRSQNPTHWRLTTYFTLSSLPKLHTVRSGYISCLATLTFPSDQYKWFKAYKAELRHDVERAPDAIQVPRRGSFESQHDTSSPGRQNLPSLTTIAPPRHSPTPSSPSVSRTPSSPYSNYMTSPQHQSSSLSSSRSTPLLPLAELQNAHPRGQRSDLDQRQLAALSSSRPASVAPLSPGQTWATPFSYTSSYANQQYNSFASSAGHATQCSVCASLGTSMSMCSRCGNWIGQ